MSDRKQHLEVPASGGVASSPLDDLLLAALRGVLARAGITHFDDHEMLRRMRDVIRSSDMDAAERALVEADSGTQAQRTRTDEWIETRMQRALRVAIEHAASERGLPAPAVPRIIVARAADPAGIAQIDDLRVSPTLLPSTTDSPCTKSILSAPEDVIVLADAARIDRFLERHSSLWVGDKNLRLRFRAGLDDRRQTVGLPPEAGEDCVEVIEATTVLHDLDDQFERARAELGTFVQDDASVRAVATDGDLSGEILGGKYELVTRIGRGGFGSVYRARDLRLDHHVAVKVLNREGKSLAALASLREEARRLTRIDHPNIVDWKTFDEAEDGTGYIVMELLEGEDLEDIIRREKRLAPDRVAHVLHEIAQALCAAHTLGDGGSILHLDLKPRNVFVLAATDARGLERVKVIDFGIAQHGGTGDEVEALPDSGGAEDSSQMGFALSEDADGTIRSLQAAALPVLGGRSSRATACTPEYASPEHIAHLIPDADAVPLDGRADLYSLGTIAFQLLTGELPFSKLTNRRRDLLEIKRATRAPSVASTGVAVPRDLAQFVDRCLEMDRDRRFANAEEACEALRRIVTRSHARRWLVAATMSLLASAGVIWKSWPDAANRPLEAFVRTIDGEDALAGRRLYFGPASPAVQVRIDDVDASSEPVRARVVARCELDAPALDGVTVDLVTADEVHIQGLDASHADARSAYLQVVRADGVAKYSAAFSVLYVPRDAVRIDRVEFDGLRARALDPRGARLEIGVLGRIELVDRVEVSAEAQRFEAQIDAAHASSDSAVWTFDPSRFGWRDGVHVLTVDVFDFAGSVRSAQASVAVISSDLDWTIACDAPRFGDRWSLTSRAESRARIQTNRMADIGWRIVKEDGTVVVSGQEDSSELLEIDLRAAIGITTDAFDGFLELSADDNAYVHHAGGQHALTRSVPIQFRTKPPSLRAWIVPCSGAPEVPLEAEAIAYTTCLEFDVRIARTCEQPVSFELTAQRSDSRPFACAPIHGLLGDRIRASFTARVAWPEDGAYSLRLRAWSAESTATDPAAPEFEQVTTIFVQSRPSRLRVEGPKDLVVGPESDGVVRVRVSADSSTGTNRPGIAPIACRWRLIAPDAREVAADLVADGRLLDEGELQLVVTIPSLLDVDEQQTAPIGVDGVWRIEVAGTDAAGNEALPSAFSFHVARTGPQTDMLLPLAAVPWERAEKGFELRIAARDPNGVARVSLRLGRVGFDVEELECELARDGTSALGTLWRGSVDLPLSWSLADVQGRILAEDGYGITSTAEVQRTLARIEAQVPDRIAVEFAGREIAAMRLVRGNRTGLYVFGGRGDDLENELFRRAGLGSFNALQTTRSWQISVSPDSIADYYLDEHEVTVAEYLEFLSADDGYANAQNWRDGPRPGLARMEFLFEQIRGLDPSLPITDVRWSEAAAYARWVGKELPSALEWEYALRGGEQYRPHASWVGGGEPIVHRLASPDRLMPVAALGDVTPDTGICDLSGNASEWTSTRAESDRPQIATTRNSDSLRTVRAVSNRSTTSEETRYWVAGGSWNTPRRDFSTLDRRRSETSSPAIGFRCRLAVAEYLARLEVRAEPHFKRIP